MLKITVFLLLFLSAFPAFAKNAGNKDSNLPPEWIENAYSVYPEAFYLTAVESGSNRKEAETSAVEALAAIFNRSISSETESSLNYSSSSKSGQAEIDKSINKNISISTNVGNLIGVEIKEVWQAPDGKYYALAVLEKAKSAELYSEKISANNASIAELIKKNEAEKNSFTEYIKCSSAYSKAVENEIYLSMLAVLNPTMKKILEEKTQSGQSLKIKCMNIAKNIPVRIEFSAVENARLKAALAKVLSEEGFNTSMQKNARYVLKADFNKSEESAPGNKILVRYTFEANLIDSSINETLTAYSANGREIHFDKNNAISRILKVLEKKIETDFSKKFKDYLSQL